MNLTKTSIESPVDAPSSIIRYQDALQYARSAVNYSFGESLYMAPSDMLLQIGKISGYNNKIVTAGPDQKLGLNEDVNVKSTPETPATPSTLDKDDNDVSVPVFYPDVPRVTAANDVASDDDTHGRNKFMLVAAAVGAFTIYDFFM